MWQAGGMAEQGAVVGNILTLIERQDWDRLRRDVAPDIHWTTGIEEQLHGIDEVLACLQSDPVPGPPAYHEVRDGLLVRWIDKSG